MSGRDGVPRPELSRVEAGLDVGAALDIECRGCGKKITLWYNGGELDERECCGFLYTLEHTKIEFVAYGPKGATADSRPHVFGPV